MGKMAFACTCAQSHLEASLSRTIDAAPVTDLLFEQSGKASIELPRGVYDVAYRAQGTPGTPFSLTVTGDATMTPVDRTLPSDGLAAGIRTLVVRALLIPVILGAFHPDAASAQDASNASNARMQAEQALATVPNVSDVLRAGYYLALQATSSSTTGTATVAVENAAGSFSASFSLEAPLNETTGEARPVTLRGLTNTGVAAVGLHWFRWPRRPDVAAMRQLCEQALHKEDCDDDELTNAKDRRAFVRLAHSGGAPVVVNLHASAGPTPFTYVDPTTLASESETKTEWSVGAGIGRYAPRMGYIAAEYEHQQQFDKGDSAQLCTLAGASATSIFDCRNVVVGGPSSRAREVGAVEWRWFLPGGKLAVNPSVARDFRGRVFSVDAPFYFLASSSAALAGGARATWRSDRPGVAIAIFIGAALHPTDTRP